MKIVQTFWAGGNYQQDPLTFSGGWMAPEYHWLSWTLSCLQLRKFYDHVELVTDSLGKHILIDLLKLPYTSVKVELDTLNHYSSKLWALAKIYTYKLQDVPFIHVDSDVFIWQPFREQLIFADLIAQNLEIDIPFYKDPLQVISNKFINVPNCMLKEFSENDQIYSCNTGVIGGNNLAFFRKYAQLAFDLIDGNLDVINIIDLTHFNICFEQYLYYCLSKQYNIELSFLIENESQFDPSYRGFANFNEVPYKTYFIHAMADYKRQDDVCWHLASRVRLDYPDYYYRTIALCLEGTGSLHQQAYHLPELSPNMYDSSYYLLNKERILSGDLVSNPDKVNWLYFYAKSMIIYENLQKLFSLPHDEFLRQYLTIDSDCKLLEEIANFRQIVQISEIRLLDNILYELDDLSLILLDSFEEGKSIGEVIEEAASYLSSEDYQYNYNSFKSLVLNRIKEMYYNGIVFWHE